MCCRARYSPSPTSGASLWCPAVGSDGEDAPAHDHPLIRAVLAGFSLDLPAGVEPWLIGVVAAFYVAVEAVTTMLARSRATPDAKVVQAVEPDGRIVAGPASPAPTGATLGYVVTEPEGDPTA